MNPEIIKKFAEFSTRINSGEDITELIKEISTYCEGLGHNEPNPINKIQYDVLSMFLASMGVCDAMARRINKDADKNNVEFNILKEKVNKLQDQMNKIDVERLR